MKLMKVSPEFKKIVKDILLTKKYGLVFPYMNLIDREGFEYQEGELNALIKFLAEFSYQEVFMFFNSLKDMIEDLPETPENKEKV